MPIVPIQLAVDTEKDQIVDLLIGAQNDRDYEDAKRVIEKRLYPSTHSATNGREQN
jgi:hypothetical protein